MENWSEKNIFQNLLALPSPGGISLLKKLRSVTCWKNGNSYPLDWNRIPSSCDPCQLLDNPANTIRRHGTLDSQAILMELGSKDSFKDIKKLKLGDKQTSNSINDVDNGNGSSDRENSDIASFPNILVASSISSQIATIQPVPMRSPSEIITSADITRGKKKRWQVESFVLVLQRLIGPSIDSPIPCPTSPLPPPFPSPTPAAPSSFPPLSRPSVSLVLPPPCPPLHIVDFGCGSGALLLPLACLYPHHRFTGVEMKPAALELLRRRAELAGVTNVSTFCGMIEDFQQAFDIGLALHACGNATDYVMMECVRQKAIYLVSPCCVGKLKFSMTGGNSFTSDPKLKRYRPRMPGDPPVGKEGREERGKEGSENVVTEEDEMRKGKGEQKGAEESKTSGVKKSREMNESVKDENASGVSSGFTMSQVQVLKHPRSEWMRSNLRDPEAVFKRMAKIADRNHDSPPAAPIPLCNPNSDPQPPVSNNHSSHACEEEMAVNIDVASLCKLHVEADRNAAASESGFFTGLFRVLHADRMAKGDLLVGIPGHWLGEGNGTRGVKGVEAEGIRQLLEG